MMYSLSLGFPKRLAFRLPLENLRRLAFRLPLENLRRLAFSLPLENLRRLAFSLPLGFPKKIDQKETVYGNFPRKVNFCQDFLGNFMMHSLSFGKSKETRLQTFLWDFPRDSPSDFLRHSFGISQETRLQTSLDIPLGFPKRLAFRLP
jgi:hypothetical protein